MASGTYFAFTATTSNTGNSFSAGTVAIVEDSGAGTAMFAGQRHWTKRSFVLASRARQDVRLGATLPQVAGARFATLNLGLRQFSR